VPLTRVEVPLAADMSNRSYSIFIDPDLGAEARAADEIARRFAGVPLGLVSDDVVGALHGGRYREALESRGVRVAYLEVAAGEASKSLDTVGEVSERLVELGLGRRAALVALGGGVVGDLTGFVASIFMRGVPWVQLPTTLLAQVDSSVGGKTGVDLDAGKNLLGSFWQPRLVYADLCTLATLPPRELSAGLAELIKHGVICDAALFERIERDADRVRAPKSEEERALLAELVAWSCRIKALVVGGDERETAVDDPAGGRARLNFGHTVGHAIEAASLETDAPLKHGEAVALGMLAAARVGAELGKGDASLEARLHALFPRLGLPVDLDPWLRPEVLARVAVDKKRTGAKLRFVIVPRLGESATVELTPEALAEMLRRRKAG
jgi:3-dehydroquinate synthase